MDSGMRMEAGVRNAIPIGETGREAVSRLIGETGREAVSRLIGEIECIVDDWRNKVGELQQYADVELEDFSSQVNHLNSIGNSFDPWAVKLKITYRREI